MNLQKAKGIIVILGIVAAISFATYYLTYTYYVPKVEEENMIKLRTEQKLTPVVVASKEIPLGTPITAENVEKSMIPAANISVKVCKDVDSIIGRLAAETIYVNEQIIVDKLVSDVGMTQDEIAALTKVEKRKFEPSLRYISIDVPKYNFVNDRIDVSSIVDILVDKGQGKYDVVLAKVAVLDKKPIGENKGAQKNASQQLKRPLPKPLLVSRQYAQEDPSVTARQLMMEGNPALEDSEDYRITIMATEKEQKRLFEAMTYGKFMLRKYVLPSQPKSKETFTSIQESKVFGDGTEGMPKLETTKPTTNPVNPLTPINPLQIQN